MSVKMPISPRLESVREEVGHDPLTLAAVANSVFDQQGRLLLAKDAGTDFWMLPGGTTGPKKLPSDAAARECWQETGLHVKLGKLIGGFGDPEFLIRYPNGDNTYYTTIAFEVTAVGERSDSTEWKLIGCSFL